MTTKTPLQAPAVSVKIDRLTYSDLANQLGIPEGTLRRKLIEFNKACDEGERIPPDEIEDHGHYKKHFFNQASAAKIQQAMLAITKRGPGRPRTAQKDQPHV